MNLFKSPHQSIAFWMLYLLFVPFTLFAQTDEPVVATISYHFIHVSDTNNRHNPIEAEMLLQLGKTNSKYSNQLFNKEFTGIPTEIISTGTKSLTDATITHYSGIPIAVVYNKGLVPGALYQSLDKKKLYSIQKIGVKDYLMEDPMPLMNWKIFNESKIIGSYTCQKAIGEFAGRMYIAWFTTEVPIAHGPWKLSGLPGLILEAKDSTGEVQFLFKEINFDKYNMAVFFPTRPIKISWEQFEKTNQGFKRDPIGTVSTQVQMNLPSSSTPLYKDAKGKLLSGELAKNAIVQDLANPINNPIEKY